MAETYTATLPDETYNARKLFQQFQRIQRAIIKRRTVSIEDFGAIGDGSVGSGPMLRALQRAWASALAKGHDLYGPAGRYFADAANLPFRQGGTPTSLLDCGNITLFGDGPATVFGTSSVNGADAFQLNGLKNFHLRDLQVETTITGAVAGSNGISVTNGWDNLTALDVYLVNLASLDKGTHIDGGKALTFQPATTVNECGKFVGRIHARGCSEGVGFDHNLVTALTKRTSIDVTVFAEDCYTAVKFSAGAATAALPASLSCGFRVRGHAVNCQRDVVLGRAHGVDVALTIVSSSSAAARRLNPNGVAWFASETTVEALLVAYARKCVVVLTGDKGATDHKARIGGTTAGSSGLLGRTEDSKFKMDVGGTAAVSDIAAINSGGNTMANCDLEVTANTATSLPTEFYTPANANRLRLGTADATISPRFTNPRVAHAIQAVSGATTLTAASRTVRVNAAGGAIPITLPPAADVSGEVVIVKKIDASANAVTVDGNGAETIDGAATYVLSAQYDTVTLQSNGTSWDIVGVA